MGTLIAVKYPTKLFLKFFDHTYVMCSTGAVRWKCWGGDQGGTQFKSGPASTIRAGKIAQPNGKAGIACYLINGVCHQAANRILMPAEVTVAGARGYWVSTSLFGLYGRSTGVGPLCESPFNEYPGVTGDLPPCVGPADAVNSPAHSEDDDPRHRAFVEEVRRLYRLTSETPLTSPFDVREFQLAVFEPLVRYRLGEAFMNTRSWAGLRALRDSVEQARFPVELAVTAGDMDSDTFVTAINHLAVGFQMNTLELIGPVHYKRLFDLDPGDTVEIGDPEIAREVYGLRRDDGETFTDS